MNKYKSALNNICYTLNQLGAPNAFERADVETVQELVDKATPKKPHLQGDGYDPSGNIVLDTWVCPNCEEYYEVGYHDYDYCPKCGQALDMMEVREYDQ